MLGRTFICAANIPAPRPTNITGRPSFCSSSGRVFDLGLVWPLFLLSSSAFRVVLFFRFPFCESCRWFTVLVQSFLYWSQLRSLRGCFPALMPPRSLHRAAGTCPHCWYDDQTLEVFFPTSLSRATSFVACKFFSAAYCFLFLDSPSLHFLLFLFLCLLRLFVYVSLSCFSVFCCVCLFRFVSLFSFFLWLASSPSFIFLFSSSSTAFTACCCFSPFSPSFHCFWATVVGTRFLLKLYVRRVREGQMY